LNEIKEDFTMAAKTLPHVNNNTYPLYIGIKTASKLSGFSEYRVRKWCQQRAIPCIATGHCYFIDREAFVEFLKELSKQHMR